MYNALHDDLLLQHVFINLVGCSDANLVSGGWLEVGSRSYRKHFFLLSPGRLGYSWRQADCYSLAPEGRCGHTKWRVLHRLARHQSNARLRPGAFIFLFGSRQLLFTCRLRLLVQNSHCHETRR